MSTSRMKRIRALDTTDDTITVEAGVVLKEIQNAADTADRLFPLSLGAEGSCQIGGNISTNAGGVQVLRYGNTRNLVLGLEVVLPDGQVWNGLRSLRKDNTGYDMKQLFIGAEGTLGIITAAVLRLFPKPTASETAWIAVDSPEAGVKLLSHMRAQLGDAVSAFELICRAVVDFLLTGVPGHEDPMREVASLVRADGRDEPGPGRLAARSAERGARRRARSRPHSRRADRGLGRPGGQTLEDARKPGRGAGLRRRHHRPRRLGAGVAHPRVHRPRRCRAGARLSRHPAVRLRPRGRRQHALQSGPPARLDPRALRRRKRAPINRIVHDIVVELGGSISAEHGIGRSRLAELAHYKAPVEIGMMRAVKNALDPHNLMNPHKVVPGLVRCHPGPCARDPSNSLLRRLWMAGSR